MRGKLALRAKKRREIKNKEKKRKLELPLGSFGPVLMKAFQFQPVALI